MGKYKIGDLVRIRTDLKEGERYNNGETNVSEEMLLFKGDLARVVDYSDFFNMNVYDYLLDIDDKEYFWSEDMLEDAKNEEEEYLSMIKKGESKVIKVTLKGDMWEFLQEKYGIEGDLEKLDEEYKKYKEEKELEEKRKRVEELKGLCDEVDREYAHHCMAFDCEDCVYFNAGNCRTMFIVDYLKKNDTIL